MISRRKHRILIVDDMPYWRKLMCNLLINYEVEAMASYREALTIIGESDYDLAILDIRLEDENIWNVDGVDLLKKIRINRTSAKVVILTGYRESVRDQILREHKPNAIIEKESFENENFREIIRKLLVEK